VKRRKLAASVAAVVALALLAIAGVMVRQEAIRRGTRDRFLGEGRRALDSYRLHHRDLLALRDRERQLCSTFRPDDGEEKRQAIWGIQEEVRDVRRILDRDLAAAVSGFTSTLIVEPRTRTPAVRWRSFTSASSRSANFRRTKAP